MGLFDKFKNVFKKEEKQEVELYDKGLEKTRKEFTSKLNLLNMKHNKIDEEYYEVLYEKWKNDIPVYFLNLNVIL